ncbi:MAG: DinB family protein [Deinococcota bacterium]
MSEKVFVESWLDVLREACEGGRPGEGTAFLDNTKPDGRGNHGLFATLDALTAEQASDPTALGTSVAAHATHVAFHLEVMVRWAGGDRGPFDWKGSFEPRAVEAAQWQTTRDRVRAAYQAVVDLARKTEAWDEDAAGGLAASLAHVAYHLGAIRQVVKLVP